MDNKAAVQERKLSQESPPHHAAVLNGAPLRRPQTLMSPQVEHRNNSHLHVTTIELIIHKDSSGYGMKVSGDNPVFVEHVKPNQAAHRAGLMAGDMILRVNGEVARTKSHVEVVRLIKASEIVRLTIQRSLSHALQRPQSMSASMSNSPSTPIAQRSSITAPLPVDHHKRKEMELSKIQTLRLMLDQERKNLENLMSDKKQSASDKARAEQNIRTLEEQLKQICGEDAIPYLLPATTTPMFQLTQSQNSHAPAFLSRFPRSLSSLSLGTKKNKPPDKVLIAPPSQSALADAAAAAATSSSSSSIAAMAAATQSSGGLHGRTQSVSVKHHNAMPASATPTKKQQKRAMEKAKSEDTPPPLPQRNNVGRKSIPTSPDMCVTDSGGGSRGHKIQISDLDKGVGASTQKLNVAVPEEPAQQSSSNRKRSKGKKAHSDPKMSTQMFIQMEARNCMSDGAEPPPLPPRQPSLAEPVQNVAGGGSSSNGTNTDVNGRFQPNSVNTCMHYPIVSTCTAVRDNFPLTHPPNIIQRLHQTQQQQQQHKSGANQSRNNRRKMASPDNVDSKRLSKDHSTDSSSKLSPGSQDDRSKLEDTPPGTPPPPYPSSQMMMNANTPSQNQSFDLGLSPPRSHPSSPTFMTTTTTTDNAQSTQKPIISMEDDETSDQEFIVEEGPFTSLKQLLDQQNLAYLAVFLNYVLLNSDPSALLFYLITGLYKDGNVKDMRKWAYEIHSTFLVPRAPLLWSSIDETMAREVDNVLQNEFDKQEILRRLFWKTRRNAKSFVNVQLLEFQDKRIAGLQTMFGPTDSTLLEAKGDKAKEQKIVEELLIPKLQQYLEEVEKVEKEVPNEDRKKIALCYALSTVLHRIFVVKSNPGGLIDKVTHFVSREKSFKRLMGKTSRKVSIKGHPLALHQYHEVTHCNHCQNIIWGLSPQGYQCEHCELNIHRHCSKALEETCPGPLQRKHGENKISKFMEKIRPTHHFIQNERKGRHDEDDGGDTFEVEQRTTTASIMRHQSDRRSTEPLNNVTFASGADTHDLSAVGATALFPVETRSQNRRRDSCKSKSAPVSVSRSESYKERSQRKNQREKRKTSDPSLGKDIDESVEPQFTNSFKDQSTIEGSSNSSQSSNMDSPSLSYEAITDTVPANVSMHSKSSSIGGTSVMLRDFDEEDDDDDLEADWSSKISPEILESMSDVEKKRQEIINEIYITERNHVRNLRLLSENFMKPLQTLGIISPENINILFPPSMTSLQELHAAFEYSIKQRRQEHEFVVRDIGDVLHTLFTHQLAADELKMNAALFCTRQQVALDFLRDLRKKNDTFNRFLQNAEAHKSCRRLQLKDLLPTVLQRLTKYPLLFDSLHKVTLKLETCDSKEASAIAKALESSKDILNHVNQEVRRAEDMHKLQMIQKKLDRSSFDKEAPPEFKNIDLTQHKLIHDGPLCLKRNPNVQLYGLLFESMMVLLQKQDDKYVLKFHPAQLGEKSLDSKFNPVTKINLIIVRQCAVEKNSFFLINTNPSQMLELSAPSASECKNWFRYISDASEAYKQRVKGEMAPKETPEARTEVPENAETIEQTGNTEVKTESLEPETATPENVPSVNENGERGDNKDQESENGGGGDDDDDDEDEDVDHHRHETILNNSRRLTQQTSLIDPTEINITTSEVMVADRVVNTEARLKRLDDEMRNVLMRKQEIVCDMFNVPYNDFQVIVDIAGSADAPTKEPADLLLAAFAQIQSLTEVVSDAIVANTVREVATHTNSLCDNCYRSQVALKNDRNAAMVSITPTTTSDATETTVRAIEDEDGYCEIEEIRHEIMQQGSIDNNRTSADGQDASLYQDGADGALSQSLSPSSEANISGASNNINNSIRTTCKNNCYNALVMQPPAAVSSHLISQHLTLLSSHFSNLMPLINQREKERETLRRENQHLRDMLNLVQEDVSEQEETHIDTKFEKIDEFEINDEKPSAVETPTELCEKENFEDAKEMPSPVEEKVQPPDFEQQQTTNSDEMVDEVDTVAPDFQEPSAPPHEDDNVETNNNPPTVDDTPIAEAALPENASTVVENVPNE